MLQEIMDFVYNYINSADRLSQYPELETFDISAFSETFKDYYDKQGWNANWRYTCSTWLRKDFNRHQFQRGRSDKLIEKKRDDQEQEDFELRLTEYYNKLNESEGV